MDSGADIRAHMAADGRLQEEINGALEDFADCLPAVADLRLVRILMRTLEPSWAEHVNFQDRVVFPIVVRLSGRTQNIDEIIHRLQEEHAALAEQHAEVADGLGDILHGDRSNGATLGYVLRSARALRVRHFSDEATLVACLPDSFAAPDVALLASWIASRPKPAFPLSVLGLRRIRSAKD